MPYSQKSLIELMKVGAVTGETRAPKHIETVISNVFIFDKNVYKFYKNDNEFFNQGFRDISDRLKRFDFSHQDFAWNRALSPSIYLKLVGVKVSGGKILLDVSESEAEELVMVMRRINKEDILFEKLMAGKISEKESYLIGQQLAESLKLVEESLPEKYNYYEIFESRIVDLRNWIKSVEEYITGSESGHYCDLLDQLRQKNKTLFEGWLSGEITHVGDVHSHNAAFEGSELHLMDTFPPKEVWRTEYRLISLYRLGVDIWVLGGNEKLFRALVRGYEDGSGVKIDNQLESIFILYSAGIMVSYLYMLQRTDKEKALAAQKFHQFIRDYYKQLVA